MIWQARKKGDTAWIDMPSPSSYKIDWEDLDIDSYRSVSTGNLIRTTLGKKWYKIGFSFKRLDPTDQKVINMFNMLRQTPYFEIKAKSIAFGISGGYVELKGYVSKCNVEMLEANLGYSCEFNFVQSQKGSWQ